MKHTRRGKAVKRPEVARIAALVGEAEAESYMALHAAYVALTRELGDRFFGGGGVALLDPKEVGEPGGDFRPGLVAFARELAGDFVCWDVRRGRPSPSERPRVVYVDHEVALAEPYARGVGGAVVHIVASALTGAPRADRARAAAAWVKHFGPVLAAPESELLSRLAAKVTSPAEGPVFASLAAEKRAVRSLLPPGKTIAGMLPPTHLSVPDPDDPRWLDHAIEGYEWSLLTYREMVHDEGRAAFGWHLAATARALSDVLLRRKRYDRAAAAAREAIAHYAPIHAGGDSRVGMMFAFAHRVVATVEARRRSWAKAYEHATRALELTEPGLMDYAAAVTGLGFAVSAWERERAGDRGEARRELAVAARHLAPFGDRDPPHAFADLSARVTRLARGQRPAARSRDR